MATLQQILQRLSPDAVTRGRQFERLCKWYLAHAPEYSGSLRHVWLWSEWPGRWGGDAGIDLVAETTEGHLWAIQSKAYDSDYAIRKSDIDSFLAESVRPEFIFRLLIATTDSLGPTARRTLDAQPTPVGRCLLADLMAAQVEWPESPEMLRSHQPPIAKPRPHQEQALKDVLSGFRDGERGQLRMACGTGKTLVGLWVTERLHSRRTLVLLPSLSLLAHSLRTWQANCSHRFMHLPVCSDETVQAEDAMALKTADLGFPVTTDPNTVADFVRRDGPLVVFTTYQSSEVIAEAFARQGVPPFDLAIADEAHRCAGTVPRPFSTILERDKIKAQRRLFMTATPRYFTGKLRREAAEYDLVIASMNDEAHFGRVFHELSFSTAIKMDLLSDYQVAIIVIDDPTYRRYADRGEFVTTDGTTITDARTLASHIAVVKAMREYDLSKLISFHNRIKSAAEFTERLPQVLGWMPKTDQPGGTFICKHVSGAMPTGRREAVLASLRSLSPGSRILVSNARCLGEGVDVPSLDGVVFIDPRRSQIEIIQAVGRAIRKSPDKKVGTVVLPVFVAATTDPKKALESSAFTDIWKVLQALRAHDDVLGETLDRLRQGLGQRGVGQVDLPGKIHVDVPVSVDQRFSEAMRLKLVESTTAAWDFWLGVFKRYIKENGHPFVPARYRTPEGYRLGAWLAEQRVAFRRNDLLPEWQRALDAIPGWEWSPHEKRWQHGFQKLTEYVRQHGNARASQDHVSPGGFRLGRWIAGQRKRFREGKLTDSRRKALESLPGWTWDAARTWETGYQKLLEYAKSRHPALIPRSYKAPGGFALGNWVTDKRQDFKKGILDPEIRQAVESVPGWKWNREDARQDIGLDRLREFAHREGHTCVPATHKEKDFPLGNWVRVVRQRYVDGRVSATLQRSLQTVPHWSWEWDQVHDGYCEWPEGLRRLQDFARRYGHACVPYKFRSGDGFALGEWVRHLRHRRRDGKLLKTHSEQLATLPGWTWNPNEIGWNRHYCALVAFARDRGIHALTPATTTDDGLKIGQWAEDQRRAYQRRALNPLRAEALNRIASWSWQTSEQPSNANHRMDWCNGYPELQGHVAEHGTASVELKHRTPGGYPLGRWIGLQRKREKAGKLPATYRDALARLPGWTWDPHGSKWESALERLRTAVAEKGPRALVLSHVMRDGFKLGVWAQIQRRAYRKGRMPSSRIRALEAIPGWTWGPPPAPSGADGAIWFKRLDEIKEFSSKRGHSHPSKMYVAPSGFHLGHWVGAQRKAFHKGQLTAEQTQALESLPGWSWGAAKDNWNRAYGELQTFIAAHGPEAVNTTAVSGDGFRIGLWVRTQRRAAAIGKLPSDRLELLKQLKGWPWTRPPRAERPAADVRQRPSPEDEWAMRFGVLRDYVKISGTAAVPQAHVTDEGFALGHWAATQRRAYKRGVLSDDRRQKLESLPGWEWDPYEGVWLRAFKHLRDVLAVLDLADIGPDYTTGDGVNLGSWVRTQQGAFRKGVLPEERRKLLESISKWKWSQRITAHRRWNDFMASVRAYAARSGSVNVPTRHVEADGVPLGSLVSDVRRNYRRHSLTKEQIAELESIPGWLWQTPRPPTYVRVDSAWEELYSLLCNFVSRHGHALVPVKEITKDGRRLGYWIGGQRKAYRQGKLSEERIRKLEALQGWTWEPGAGDWEADYDHAACLLKGMSFSSIRQTYVAPDGFRLGRWINYQRMYRQRGTLSAEQIEKIESIPGWTWDTLDAQWDAAFRMLLDYIRETGRSHVPIPYKVPANGFNLGQWVRNQKRLHREGKLRQRRIDALARLPGWEWHTEQCARRTVPESENTAGWPRGGTAER